MPGLIGVVSRVSAADAANRFNRAATRMLRHGGLHLDSKSLPDGKAHLGRVRLEGSITQENSASPPSDAATGTIAAAIDGVLYNLQELRGEIDGPEMAAADVVAGLYRRFGLHFVARLDGEFAVALVDVPQRVVLIATDQTGGYPLRWRVDSTGLVFGSDLSAVLQGSPGARRLNLRAVADYLTAGIVFGDKTLVEDVQELASGTVLRYDIEDGTVSVSEYACQTELFESRAADRPTYFAELEEAFGRAVRRAVGDGRGVGLSLSGGLDSRAILSALNGRGPSVHTYTLGVAGCADHTIARRLASLARTTHHSFLLDAGYLRDFLPTMAQMVSITDGMYLSHGLTEMLALRFLRQTGIQVLLRGHGGELAKASLAWPLHTDSRVYATMSKDVLIAYLSERANYITPSLSLSAILLPAAADRAGRGSPDSLAEVLRGVELLPAATCSYLYLHELHHRFTVPSLELFRTRVEVRQPFLDVRFLKVLLAAPPEWRDDTTIHQRLIGAGHQAMLRVRNSNTGARADAGSLHEYVLDKVNTALRRLNVSGYRHYHNFDGWMRESLLESVEATLLRNDSPSRAYVAAPTLESLIARTRRGEGDHAYLLQVLLILDIWQRENRVEADV